MRRKLVIIVTVVLALGAAAGGLGFYALDSEETISGPKADRAADSALRATGGGELLGVERGDDGGATYEVEIRKSDGTVAEVLLGDDYKVLEIVAGDADE